MAPRSFWKGYLKLSLVNCPVSMTPAITEREKVRFHTLNRRTDTGSSASTPMPRRKIPSKRKTRPEATSAPRATM